MAVKVYCPHCKSTKPMWKAGFQLHVGGRPPKQRYQCKSCHRFSVAPKKWKPRPKKPATS